MPSGTPSQRVSRLVDWSDTASEQRAELVR